MLIVLFQVLRMSSKRPAEDQGGGSSSGPPAKKLLTRFEPVRIGTIGNLVSFFSAKEIEYYVILITAITIFVLDFSILLFLNTFRRSLI